MSAPGRAFAGQGIAALLAGALEIVRQQLARQPRPTGGRADLDADQLASVLRRVEQAHALAQQLRVAAQNAGARELCETVLRLT